MSFVTRFVDLLRDAAGPASDVSGAPDAGEDRLAAAALLVHVARIDGKIDAGEHRTLVELLGSAFGLSPGAAASLLARADSFDREVDDVAVLVEMLGHGAPGSEDGPDRERLLAMAYRVAAADGVMHEFEDDLVWRLGHLLGFDDEAITAARDRALAGPAGT